MGNETGKRPQNETEQRAQEQETSSFRRAIKRFENSSSLVDTLFLAASTVVVEILALIALVAILVSTWGVGVELVNTLKAGDYSGMSHVITSTLTVFIFIEVLSVSIRYLKVHNIDVKDLLDVTFAIIFREIWVGLFSGHLDWKEMLAYAALVAVLGAVRWLTLRSRGMGDELVDENGDPISS